MSQKKTAEKKTIDLDAMEGQAGMITSELLEWGLYVVLQTFDGTNWSPSDAGKTLKDLRDQHGEIPEQRTPSNPLADFAEKAGLSAKELNELALLSVCDMLDSSEFPEQPCHLLADAHREMGTLLPHFPQDYDEIEVHPFMAALFSGQLSSAAYVPPEKETDATVYVSAQLEKILESERMAEDRACEIYGLYSAIKYNPELRQEAAAMKVFYEAQNVLQEIVGASNRA